MTKPKTPTQISIADACRKYRKVVSETDIPCDQCGVKLLVEEPGSETSRWLHCHKCGQYHYFVSSTVSCCLRLDPSKPLSKDYYKRMGKALGVTSLQPWVLEKVRQIEKFEA